MGTQACNPHWGGRGKQMIEFSPSLVYIAKFQASQGYPVRLGLKAIEIIVQELWN